MEGIGVVYFYIHSVFSFRVYRILTLLIPFYCTMEALEQMDGSGIRDRSSA